MSFNWKTITAMIKAVSLSLMSATGTVSVILMSVVIKLFSIGQLTHYEVLQASFSIIALLIMAYLVSLLQKMSQDHKENQKRIMFLGEKMSFIEQRLMWLVAGNHEVKRMINAAFYEWDRDRDEQYFFRQVKQTCELWSASQHRQGLPSGLPQWQFVLYSALCKIAQEVHAMGDGRDKVYFTESLRVWSVQRATSPYTRVINQSPQALCQAYVTQCNNRDVLMSSLQEP